MAWLNSDLVKNLGAVLAAVCGTLVVLYPPPNTIGIVAGVLLGVLAALGLKSGGTSGAQPPNVVTK